MNKKEKRDAKNGRHRRNEKRRAVAVALKKYPAFCRFVGVDHVAELLRIKGRKSPLGDWG
jgi:hypothetical protein